MSSQPPFTGHWDPSGPLLGQPLRTQGILRCFPYSPDMSTQGCCFSTPTSYCCKISLLGVASLRMMTGIQPWVPCTRVFTPNTPRISMISHLLGNQCREYLLRVLQHLSCTLALCPQLKCYFLWNKKLLRLQPSSSPTPLNCQALAFDKQSKPWRRVLGLSFKQF